MDILDHLDYPVFFIFDARELHIDFNQILTASATFMGENRILRHPNIREYILVSPMGGANHIIKGLDTAPFGNVKIKLFGTPEEALAYVRKAVQP